MTRLVTAQRKQDAPEDLNDALALSLFTKIWQLTEIVRSYPEMENFDYAYVELRALISHEDRPLFLFCSTPDLNVPVAVMSMEDQYDDLIPEDLYEFMTRINDWESIENVYVPFEGNGRFLNAEEYAAHVQIPDNLH